jgi:8-oxo-dGTP pyrophosphatase MutT (NUDIX family)
MGDFQPLAQVKGASGCSLTAPTANNLWAICLAMDIAVNFAQMYEIYINDRPLRLLDEKSVDYNAQSPSTELIARYNGKVKTLLHYADLLEKGSPKVTSVILYAADLEQLWLDFKSHYKIVPAAGGVVNLVDTNRYLFIYRLGYLDLPKGKIDEGETELEAAVREVREETGLKSLACTANDSGGKTVPDYQLTWHTYRTNKGKRVLKPTYWFQMTTSQKELIPETDEGIEWARWLSIEAASNASEKFYPSLRKLLKLPY